MLTNTEKNILNIFKDIYELKITNNIDENLPNMNIIFDETHITNTQINSFFQKSKKYIPNILEYSLTYALTTNNKTLINTFKELDKNINDINSLDIKIKREILYYAIKYILNKKKGYINLNEINILKNNNIKLYSAINNLYKINTINDIIRNTVFNLSKELNTEIDTIFVKKIILTNEYDNEIIKINNYINNYKDLKYFKLFLTKIFLNDSFILEIYGIKKTIEKHPDIFPKNSVITSKILEHIKVCIKNNKYELPNKEETLKEMINNFIYYYKNNDTQFLDYAEKTCPHILKKIYPMYIMDRFK